MRSDEEGVKTTLSCRFGSDRIGSVRIGSVRFGSVRFGSVRFLLILFFDLSSSLSLPVFVLFLFLTVFLIVCS